MAAAVAAAVAYIVHEVRHGKGGRVFIRPHWQAALTRKYPPPSLPPLETGEPDLIKTLHQDFTAVTTPAPPPTPAVDAAAAAAAAALPASLSPTRLGAKRASFLLDSPLAGVTAEDLHVPPRAPLRVARSASRASASGTQQPAQDDWAAQLERLEGAL